MRKLLIGSMILLTVGILSAQDFAVTFTSKTPFAVAGATVPAGSYTIKLLDEDSNLFECSSTSGSHSVMFEADRHEVVPKATEVTFAKYGDKLVLKNISIAGTAGYWVPVSLPEKASKKGGAKPTPVAMTAAKN
jgi:hypothetical protein